MRLSFSADSQLASEIAAAAKRDRSSISRFVRLMVEAGVRGCSGPIEHDSVLRARERLAKKEARAGVLSFPAARD
jgi:hypothetical protein